MIHRARLTEASFFLMLALAAPGSAADDPVVPKVPAPAPTPTKITTPGTAGETEHQSPGERLKLSPTLVRQVSSALPVWKPRPAPAADKVPPPDPGVVAMKPFIVRENRIKLTETDVLSDSEKVELAKSRQLSPLYRVTFGPLSQIAGYYFNFLSILGGWHPNDADAMALERQDQRLKMLDELDSLARIEALGGDAKDAKEFQRIRYEASAASR